MTVTAMVCQRDPEVRAQVAAALRSKRFAVVEAENPSALFAALDVGTVAVAVVDWQAERSLALFKVLAKRPEVTAFLFEDDLVPSDAELAFRVCPRLLTHGRSLGASLLADRVVAATGKVVGDLFLRNGSVAHSGDGSPSLNRVGARLLAAHPSPVHLPEHSDQQAVFRFRRWLAEVGSSWTVACVRRGSLYRLVDVVDRAA